MQWKSPSSEITTTLVAGKRSLSSRRAGPDCVHGALYSHQEDIGGRKSGGRSEKGLRFVDGIHTTNVRAFPQGGGNGLALVRIMFNNADADHGDRTPVPNRWPCLRTSPAGARNVPLPGEKSKRTVERSRLF